MNLLNLEQLFKNLEKVEKCVYYSYDPSTVKKNMKRHSYYEDIEKDFQDEVETYGCLPFNKSISIFI